MGLPIARSEIDPHQNATENVLSALLNKLIILFNLI